MVEASRLSPRWPRATLARVYQVLFFTLLLSTLLLVLFAEDPLLRGIAEISTGLVLISAALAASWGSRHFVVVLGLGIVMFISHAASIVYDLGGFEVVARGTVVTFVLILSVALARDVFFRRETVDVEVIYGAMSLYLLIGFAFGYAFAACDQLEPGSIRGLVATNVEHGLFGFFYFSFVTLTTLGYGDMAPLTAAARGLAMTEALLGQIYLAVVIARLVAMYGSSTRMP